MIWPDVCPLGCLNNVYCYGREQVLAAGKYYPVPGSEREQGTARAVLGPSRFTQEVSVLRSYQNSPLT